MKGIKLFASTSSDQSQNSAYLFVSPALISTAKFFFRRHDIRFLQQWPHDGVTSKFPSLAVIKKHLFTSFLLSVSLLSFRCQIYQRTSGKSTVLYLTKANHACLYAAMNMRYRWTVTICSWMFHNFYIYVFIQTQSVWIHFVTSWWKSILVVPLTHPPSITPTASLSCYLPIHQLTSTVSMDTIKHAKNTAKRDHDPCLLPRGSYAWAQRHES